MFGTSGNSRRWQSREHSDRLSLCTACVSIRIITQKTNDSNVFNLGTGSDLPWDILRVMVSSQKVKGQGYRVTKCKNILKAIVSHVRAA